MNKLILIGVCLALTLILGFTLVLPKYQDFQTLSANIQQGDAELKNKEEYFSQIKNISEELVQYQEARNKILSALPEEPSLPTLFDFVQATTAQTGLVLEEVSLNNIGKPTEDIKDIKLSIQVAGTYSALKSFLTALESSSRMITVETISFSSPEELSDPFSFAISIKTQSY